MPLVKCISGNFNRVSFICFDFTKGIVIKILDKLWVNGTNEKICFGKLMGKVRRLKMAEKVDYAALKKGGFMRQKQKGCFSLRIAVVGGNLTAENIKTVAEVAEKYGHGYVHMTSRQGIEIPFIKVEDINVVKEELAKGGVGTGVCGPRVRTITACQGSEICPSGCIDTYTLAKELDERYFGRELPHKFKFGVTGCQNNCLKAEENDVGIKGGMTVECSHDDCIQCGVCVKACREGALSNGGWQDCHRQRQM